MNNRIMLKVCYNLLYLTLLVLSFTPLVSTSQNLLKTSSKLNQSQTNTASVTTPSNNSSSSQKPFFDIYQSGCNAQNCPLPYAYCTSGTNCHCSSGFANFRLASTNPTNNLPCQYTQKKQLVAFLLEFFFPFGVGHFYSQRTVIGILKLLFIVATPCLFCCLLCCGLFSMDSLSSQKVFSTLSATLGLIYTIGLFAWVIVDLVFFGLNKYTDGNGVPLQEW